MRCTDSYENGEIKIKVEAKGSLKKDLYFQMFKPETLITFSWT